eukprot:190683_1
MNDKSIPWQHTEIKQLSLPYLEQLLLNRNVNEENIPENKIEAIQLLKHKYTVKLKPPIENLTCCGIIAELSLYGIYIPIGSNVLKSKLIKQLKNEMKHHAQSKHWIYMNLLNYSQLSMPFIINNNELTIVTN